MKHPMEHEMKELCQVISLLRTQEECRLFLEDICTIKELQAMSQRWQVARQLADGKNYLEVCQNTGASSTTISRVNKCLVYGNGGYRLALERMEEEKTDGIEN